MEKPGLLVVYYSYFAFPPELGFASNSLLESFIKLGMPFHHAPSNTTYVGKMLTYPNGVPLDSHGYELGLLSRFVIILMNILHKKDTLLVVVLLCVVLLFICNLTLFICNCGFSYGLQDGPHCYPLLWYLHYVFLLIIPLEDNLPARVMSITLILLILLV